MLFLLLTAFFHLHNLGESKFCIPLFTSPIMGIITTTRTGLLVLLAATTSTILTTPARAQFGGPAGPGGGYYGGGNSSPYSAGAGDVDGDGAGGAGLGFGGRDTAARAAHGILACLAFVVLFPLGAVLVRVVPGRWSLHAHWAVQMLAWVLYVAAFALGVDLARGMRVPGGSGGFLSNPSISYHPIIGIVVFVLLLAQPILGIIHHKNFKAVQRRTVSSYLHVWDGRVTIILGITNGGLGLQLAGAGDTLKLAYTIVAAIFGGTWIVLAVLSECRRKRGSDMPGSNTREGRAIRMERLQKAVLGRGSGDGSPGRPRHQDNVIYR